MSINIERNRKIKTFVINLDGYESNYNKQRPYLENIGLDVERFKAINAIKDEHLPYKKYITTFAKLFTPKSVIGCALSHLLCCEYIHNTDTTDTPYFLIMEDDAYPLYDEAEFHNRLLKTITDIDLLDSKWDIIQLHSDAFYPTTDTFITHFATGSTAAYLISRLGIRRMLKQKVFGHLDFETQNFIKFNKYRVKQNLFYTNETDSLNRMIDKGATFNRFTLLFKSGLMEKIHKYLKIFPLRGEKTYANFLEFKMFKIWKKEFTANEIIDYLFGYFIFRRIFRPLHSIS